MATILTLFIFFFGLAIGSFLNVVIYRLDQPKSFFKARSFCPVCKKKIAWYDNLPLLSFIILGGKCRQCHKKISWQYPLVELATAVIFVWFYRHLGLTPAFLAALVYSAFLLIIFVYDLKHYLILDKIAITAIVIAFIFNLYLGLGFFNLLLGALIGAGFFALQFFVSRGKWVGDGDIRLGALMGLILGWKLVLVALFLAYFAGAIISLTLVGFKKKKMSAQIPFGPFLAGATLVTMLYGKEILHWYLNLVYF